MCNYIAMNEYNLKEEIKKYFYVFLWSAFFLNTFAYPNPNLSYLDDTEIGSGSFSPFLTVIGWIGLFYYFVLHKQVLRWKEKKKSKKNFTTLVTRLHNIDKELGICFERNVTFIRFDENILYWNSYSKGLDNKLLNKHGMLILWHVRHIFGSETRVSNKHKEKTKWKKWWDEKKVKKETIEKKTDDDPKGDTVMNIVVIGVLIVSTIVAKIIFE